MRKEISLFVTFIYLVTPSLSWYDGRTDLPDGDAERSCSTLEGLDIGRDLPNEFQSNYLTMPKGQWYRIRGQIRRMSYDAPDSILRFDEPHRQGNCYFQANSNIQSEYIQSFPFPRVSSSSTPYNYYFSASMIDNDGGIHLQLEWYDEQNQLMNTTSIHSNILINQHDAVAFSQSNQARLGKIVSDAKTMLIRITIDAVPSQSAIDMINVVFFPDHVQGNGRPGK